jgi:predicted small lipoprotein YifL
MVELDARGHRLRVALAAVLVASLAGCATYGRVGPLPVVPDGATAAEIVIAREYRFTGSGVPIAVVIDGIPTHHIGTNEYVRILVSAGRHVVRIRAMAEESLAVDAEADRRYGFIAWIGSIFHPGPFIRQIDDIDSLTTTMTQVR